MVSKSRILNDENIFIIPPEMRTSRISKSFFQRTTLQIIVLIFLSSPRNQSASASTSHPFDRCSLQNIRILNNQGSTKEKYCKRFAFKLHSFTHYQLYDMVLIWQRANILTGPLKQALKLALEKCTSCKTTGRPRNSKELSFDKMLRNFSEPA